MAFWPLSERAMSTFTNISIYVDDDNARSSDGFREGWEILLLSSSKLRLSWHLKAHFTYILSSLLDPESYFCWPGGWEQTQVARHGFMHCLYILYIINLQSPISWNFSLKNQNKYLNRREKGIYQLRHSHRHI